MEVMYKCVCRDIFRGSYKEILTMLKDHLMKECPEILCPVTRKLVRVANRFQDLGVPQKLIDFYKSFEPFYFLDSENVWSQPRDYVSELGKGWKDLGNEVDQYEGEVDKNGEKCGKGIRIAQNCKYFLIYVGNFSKNKLNGLSCKFTFYKDTSKIFLYFGQMEDNNLNQIGTMDTNFYESYQGYYKNNQKNGIGRFTYH